MLTVLKWEGGGGVGCVHAVSAHNRPWVWVTVAGCATLAHIKLQSFPLRAGIHRANRNQRIRPDCLHLFLFSSSPTLNMAACQKPLSYCFHNKRTSGSFCVVVVTDAKTVKTEGFPCHAPTCPLPTSKKVEQAHDSLLNYFILNLNYVPTQPSLALRPFYSVKAAF